MRAKSESKWMSGNWPGRAIKSCNTVEPQKSSVTRRLLKMTENRRTG